MSARPDLLRDPIPKLVGVLAAPASAGMFFQMLFNTADTYFAGQWSAKALTALAGSFPIFLLVIAAALGFGQGATALIARALGEGDHDAARAYFAHALIAGALLGAMMILFAIVGVGPSLALLGLRGEALELAASYLRPIFVFAVSVAWAGALNAFLTAQGDAKPYRNALALGAIVNLGLDPLLMWGAFGIAGLGLAGIAWSTVLIQAGQALYLAHVARRSPLGAELRRADFAFSLERLLDVFRQGTPASATMIFTGVGLFLFTHFIARHGEAAVAAYGVSLRIEQMVLLLSFGLNGAALTLVAQNRGAGRIDRVREAARFTLLLGVGLMLLGAVFVHLAKAPLLGLFTDDPDVVAVGVRYLSFAVWIFPAYALLFVATAVLQGLERPAFAMGVGFARHVVGPAILLPIAGPVLGLGLDGVFVSILLVAWLGALAAVPYMARRLAEL